MLVADCKSCTRVIDVNFCMLCNIIKGTIPSEGLRNMVWESKIPGEACPDCHWYFSNFEAHVCRAYSPSLAYLSLWLETQFNKQAWQPIWSIIKSGTMNHAYAIALLVIINQSTLLCHGLCSLRAIYNPWLCYTLLLLQRDNDKTRDIGFCRN